VNDYSILPDDTGLATGCRRLGGDRQSPAGSRQRDFQLFDLGNDPLERESLFERPEFAAISAGLRARLEACQKEAGDPLLNP
jgi:hypothetical protein